MLSLLSSLHHLLLMSGCLGGDLRRSRESLILMGEVHISSRGFLFLGRVLSGALDFLELVFAMLSSLLELVLDLLLELFS